MNMNMNKYLYISVFYILLFSTAAHSEIIPLQMYTDENNFNIKEGKWNDNGQEVMFNISLRCNALWGAIDELPELYDDGKVWMKKKQIVKGSDVTWQSIIDFYIKTFNDSLNIFNKNYEKDLSEMTVTYKKKINESFQITKTHLQGIAGRDLVYCNEFYADLSGIDINEKYLELEKLESQKENDNDVVSQINHIDLWQKIFTRWVSVAASSGKTGSDFGIGYMERVISEYCITLYNTPVCPYVDASKYEFDSEMWNKLNESTIAISVMTKGTILGMSDIEYLKHLYCVTKFKTTRCFEDQ